MTSFHEVVFPQHIALGAGFATERRTEVVALASGFEERNSRWAHSRRQYDAGQGVRTLDDLHTILSFFEERRGQLYAFRWHDRLDCKSCEPSGIPAASDQQIGIGDGTTTQFQLAKVYGEAIKPYTRIISKPLGGSVDVAVNGTEVDEGTVYTVDDTTGLITFIDGAPSEGAIISAGFEFHVPVRFATDRLDVNLTHFSAGDIPTIPLMEVRV